MYNIYARVFFKIALDLLFLYRFLLVFQNTTNIEIVYFFQKIFT